MIRRTRPLWLLVLLALPLACAKGTGSTGGHDGGVACTTSKECPTSYTCSQGVCTPKQSGGSCSTGSCPAHQFCGKSGSCVSSGQQRCQTTSDCGGDFTCDPNTGLCVEQCVTTNDCASPLVCNPALKYCAQCTFDTDCTDPRYPHCLQTTGQCVACTVAGQCDPGSYCALGSNATQPNTCQPGCLTGGDCPVNARCDRPGTDPGRCVECTVPTEAQDCTTPGKPVCDPNTQLCVQCVQDTQCGVQVCNTSTETCVDCLDDTTCTLGQVCDTSSDSCVAGCTDSAKDNARCPPPGDTTNTLCDGSRGTFGQCVQCLTNTDCSKGNKCDGTGHCVPGCDVSADCPASLPICDHFSGPNGKCVQCRSDGDCPAPNLYCDTSASSPTYEMCLCKVQGMSCTSTASCGLTATPSRANTCGGAWCVAQVECSPNVYVRLPTDTCGNLCSDPANGTGCPSGYTCHYVKNEAGTGPQGYCVATNACP